MGDSSCTGITVLYDTYVEIQETFEVILQPNPESHFGAFIQPGQDRAVIIISDGEDYRSMLYFIFTQKWQNYILIIYLGVNIGPSLSKISIMEGQ